MASILGAFQAAQTAANRANLQRYKEGINIYDRMISDWGKGGGFVKGQIAQLERRKTRGVAAGMQSLVSSGLAGTTMAAGLGKKWEEEVGTTARLSIADIAGQRLMQARQAKAGFIERRQDTGPDPSLVMSAMRETGRTSVGTGTGGRTEFGYGTTWRGSGRRETVRQPSIARVAGTARRARSPYASQRVTASTPSTGAFRTLINRRRY